MTQQAIDLTRSGVFGLQQLAQSCSRKIRAHAPTREVALLGLALVILQLMDGLLTAIGVANFGTSAEGNPLLYMLMEQFGYGPALIATKALSIVIIGILCSLASRVSWLIPALKAVVVIYIAAAIVPWSVILVSKLVLA